MKNNIILGDNAFWGVNHYDKDIGNDVSVRFKDTGKIIEIIEESIELGINDFMLSSHGRVIDILNELDRKNLNSHVNLLPNIPYIIKYVQKASQEGIPSLIKSYLPEYNFLQKILFMIRSGKDFIVADVYSIVKEAIDRELSVFNNFRLPIIFLHNGITDLMLGLGGNDLLHLFSDHIASRYNSIPGFITLNPIMLNDVLKSSCINDAYIMSPFNNNGFHMNPSQKKVENLVNDISFNYIPMNIFSSGTNRPDISIEYLSTFDNISKIIIGTSNPQHIRENIKLYNKYFNER